MNIEPLIHSESEKVMIEFEKRFIESKGKPFAENGTEYHMVLRVNSESHQGMHVRLVHAIQSPRQGIRFDCNLPLHANGVTGQALVFWRDTVPSEFDIACSPDSDIVIRNVWDNGDGVEQSWHAGGAMIVKNDGNIIILRANSTLSNDRCEDLVVELSWLDGGPQETMKKISWFSRLFGC